MSVTPPSGYATYAAYWTIAGSTREVVCTAHMANPGGQTAQAIEAIFSTNLWFGTGKLFDMASCSTVATRVKGYVLANIAGSLTSYASNYATAGTGSNTAPSPNVSLILNKRTALAGRAFRGFTAVPSIYIDETFINPDGSYSSTPLSNWATKATAFITNSVAANLTPVLLHSVPKSGGPAPVPTVVTSIIPNSHVGTMRHRIKR